MSEVLQTESTKSANQQWLEYKRDGGKMDFLPWLEQQKATGTFIKNDTLTSIVDDARKDIGIVPQAKTDNTRIMGISKTVLIASVAIVTLAIAVKVYRNNR